MGGEDSWLGLDRRITRRDFLDGVRLAVLGAAASGPAGLLQGCAGPRARSAYAPERQPGYYPPALTGLRGDHPGSFEVAHAVKDGSRGPWGSPTDTGERYDLVVVGAGLSGLSAAYFYRQAAGPKARILILDNHDDFGGHAKRNEFQQGGRLLLGFGGTESIERWSEFSRVGKTLLRELGVDLRSLAASYDRSLYRTELPAAFFDRETFGEDKLVPGEGVLPWSEFLPQCPPGRWRDELAKLHAAPGDYFPGLSGEAKRARLRAMSYSDFLLTEAGAHRDVLPYLQKRTHSTFAAGIDAVPALECWRMGLPGFSGLGLGEATDFDALKTLHFPDGCASVARLLVRSLIPQAIPGSDAEDVVTARADYSRLDGEGSPARLRLNSTVVGVANEPGGARVTYVRGGRAWRVRAGGCVLACQNTMIPFLCPDLPREQKAALSFLTRAPIVYANVLLRSRLAFRKLGAASIHAPGGFFSYFAMDYPVSMGDYRFPASPEEPVVVHMLRVPASPGLPPREQRKRGQRELLETPFETFERHARDLLGRALGAGGFDPAADVLAVTVNRWPHGYSYEPNPLSDPEWTGAEKPWVLGRRPFGRIVIASADSGAYANMSAAMEQAHRAVGELS